MFIFLGLGFHLSHDKRECIDEDECGRSGVCSNGQCSNIDGGFRYVLPRTRNIFKSSKQRPEVPQDKFLSTNSRCVCNEGFELSSDGLSCRDVDECDENPFVCLHGRCRNTQGTYICQCQLG